MNVLPNVCSSVKWNGRPKEDLLLLYFGEKLGAQDCQAKVCFNEIELGEIDGLPKKGLVVKNEKSLFSRVFASLFWV